MSTHHKSKNKETKYFTKPQDVDTLLEHLQKKLGVIENADGSYDSISNWRISDVHDKKGRQYVDLVQKGGGVWGIALVGFTYVMEGLGIRFLRLAGTSAGAINTVLLAAISEKEDKKSDSILKLLAEKDIFEFVDGHNVVRKVLNFFAKNRNKEKLFKKTLLLYGILLIAGIVFLLSPFAKVYPYGLLVFHLTGILIIIPLLFLAFGTILYHRMGQAGLGINPGENFLIWLRNVLNQNLRTGASPGNTNDKQEQNLSTTKLLELKVKKSPPLHLTQNINKDISGLDGDITIITADLVTKNKIELPRMIGLFNTNKGYKPFQDSAEMVRASMAIPLFFESFYARNIDAELTKKSWNETFNIDPPNECRFVDGGIMSNFPINIYFNPYIMEPRLPTIGINLIEYKDINNAANNKPKSESNHWNLFKYLGNLFNASRYYYDKDFILKNKTVSKSIADVPIKDINWLDFGLDVNAKQDLFMQGAMAAYLFFSGDKWSKQEAEYPVKPFTYSGFKGFNWPEYKKDRTDMAIRIKQNSNRKSK